MVFAAVSWCSFKLRTSKCGEMGDFFYGDMEVLLPKSLI